MELQRGESEGGNRVIRLCGGAGQEAYLNLKIQGAYLKREYSDLMVVGIVVLFLAVVVAMEAAERVGDLYVPEHSPPLSIGAGN